jgi:pyrimidine deaminase RibD-like protein
VSSGLSYLTKHLQSASTSTGTAATSFSVAAAVPGQKATVSQQLHSAARVASAAVSAVESAVVAAVLDAAAPVAVAPAPELELFQLLDHLYDGPQVRAAENEARKNTYQRDHALN